MLLMVGIGATLATILYCITRPESPPTCLEEEIVRKAILRIKHHNRPPRDTKVEHKYGGMVVMIPFTNNDNIQILFADGTATLVGHSGSTIPLAVPDSINRLANAIERVWIGRHR